MMSRLAVLLGLVVLGCDKPTEPTTTAPAASSAEPAPSAPAASAPIEDAGASDASVKVTMPERPVPKDVAVVRMDMSEEIQMKASAYMAAMRAPHVGDPSPDTAFVEELRGKLAPLSRAADKGANKATMNKTEISAGGRVIDLLMADGCQPDTPAKLAARAATPLSTLYAHGILVLRCNDKSLQCLQSTRDTSDVLCTSAPRKGRGGLPGR